MKANLFLALSFVLAVGCKKDPIDQVISDLDSWKSKMCACSDNPCTEKVHTEFKKYQEGMREKFKSLDKDDIDKSKVEKIEKMEKEYKACRRKYDAPEPTP
jgi:hypothetical protein